MSGASVGVVRATGSDGHMRDLKLLGEKNFFQAAGKAGAEKVDGAAPILPALGQRHAPHHMATADFHRGVRANE